MNWQLIIGSGGLVGIGAIIFYLGRIVARFEARFDAGDRNQQMIEARMDDKFKGMDKRMISEFETISKRYDATDRKIDSLENKFENRCDKIDARLDKIGNDIQDVKSRLDRLEVRVEERTLKVVTFQREPQEKILEHV